jgi:hypothetical protein
VAPDDPAELPELAGLDHRADPGGHRPRALVEDDAELPSLVRVRGEHPLAVRDVDGKGLVGEDVEARPERVDRHGRMAPVRRGDHDRVHAARRDHRPVVRKLRARQVRDPVERPRAERGQLEPLDGADRLRVRPPHAAHADNADPDAIHGPSSFRWWLARRRRTRVCG